MKFKYVLEKKWIGTPGQKRCLGAGTAMSGVDGGRWGHRVSHCDSVASRDASGVGRRLHLT